MIDEKRGPDIKLECTSITLLTLRALILDSLIFLCKILIITQ